MVYNSVVYFMQKTMNALGFNCGKPDGKAWTKTKAGFIAFVKEYNRLKGIEPTKPVEPKPIKTDGYIEYVKEIKYGEVSKEVGYIQSMLNWQGIPVDIDNVFGTQTKNGICEFVRGLGKNAYGIERLYYRTITQEIWKMFNVTPLDLSKWADSVFDCNCNGKYCDSYFLSLKPSKARAMLCARADILAKEMYDDNVETRLTDDINPDNPTDKNGGDRCKIWNAKHGGAANSQHRYRRAADLALFKDGEYWKVDHRAFEKEAAKLNPYGGASLNYTGNIHLDARGYYSRW